METLRIDILNPKAEKLLQDLADLDLIAIHEAPKNSLTDLLNRLRSKEKPAPTLEEISHEVEEVRTKRYANKG